MMLTNDSYNLSEIPADFAGGTNELTEPQKAQIKMTYWVLGGAVCLLILSGGAYIVTEHGLASFAHDIQSLCLDRAVKDTHQFCAKYSNQALPVTSSSAKEIFEFCKNFIPPIVTLVLGAHYVTRSTESNS